MMRWAAALFGSFVGSRRPADEQALAIDVFRLNTVGHPGQANPWDSLGEAHLAVGNRAEAIINYRRSLRLNPANDNARRVLRELGA